jgi:hypothetical protein
LRPSEIYKTWAPARSVWSRWAKPAIFAQITEELLLQVPRPKVPIEGIKAPDEFQQAAIIVELPGQESVLAGLALAQAGYTPVPLYNSCVGPDPVVPLWPIIGAIAAGVDVLSGMALSDDAPPAFLLDSNRLKTIFPATPGRFDNRWMVFQQDFPSAKFLKSHGISKALLIQEAKKTQTDLLHVLSDWQEAGISLFAKHPTAPGAVPLKLKPPSWLRAHWQRNWAARTLGLKRNSSGSFGAIVPEHPTGGG